MPSFGRRRMWPIIRMIVSCLFILLIGEIGLRLYLNYSDKNTLEALSAHPLDLPQNLQSNALSPMVRLSPHPRIIYELKPQHTSVFMDQPVNTNSLGFRSPEISIEKPNGTTRILGIGDSVMFGWGVRDEETYLARLQELLSQHYPDRRWECVNTAVPGYNTAMEIETLKTKGLALKPDIVIVAYVWNDPAPPPFLRKKPNYFSINHSYLSDLVTNRIRGASNRYQNSIMNANTSESEWDPARVPEEYRTMVGTAVVRNALAEMAVLSKRNKFHFIAMTQTVSPPYLKDMCSELGIPLIEPFVEEPFKSFIEKHPFQNINTSWYTLNPKDTHPSKLSHELYAQLLFSYLKDKRLIP